MIRTASFLSLLLFLFTTAAFADKDEMVEQGWYAFRGDNTRVYILDPPKNMEDEKKYPLVLLLHGFSGQAKKAAGAWHWTPGKEKFYVLAPKSPASKKIDGLSTYTWNKGRDFKYVHDLILHVLAEYPIDKTEVYVVGYGSGGDMALHLINKHPRLFSKLVLVGGGSVSKKDKLPGFKGLSVFILGSQQDSIFTVKRIMPMAETMKKAGADVHWEILEREISSTLYKRTDVLVRWMFE